MKNGVECYKDFFGYFNTLKTNCVIYPKLKIVNKKSPFKDWVLSIPQVAILIIDLFFKELTLLMCVSVTSSSNSLIFFKVKESRYFAAVFYPLHSPIHNFKLWRQKSKVSQSKFWRQNMKNFLRDSSWYSMAINICCRVST